MRYRNLFPLLGIGVMGWGWTGALPLSIAVWLGLNFIILGIAHHRGNHKIFGKRANGKLSWWSWLLFFPLLLGATTVWHIIRIFSREPAQGKVTDHLAIGRRLMARERTEQYENFVDLTSEFSEPASIRNSPSYRCFPILDGAAPSLEELHVAVTDLGEGSTFVHCAQGHGRTALFALAYLLNKRIAVGVDDGLDMLRAARPAVRLNREQEKCIRLYARKYCQ